MRELKKHKFSKVFDLQNSSRTSFYKKILFPKATQEIWSSSTTTLSKSSPTETSTIILFINSNTVLSC